MPRPSRKLRILFWVLPMFILSLPGTTIASDDDGNIYRDLNLFSEVLQRVQSDYVDEVEMRELIVGGIRGMLKTLDPHTQFLDTKQFRDLMVGTKGSFGGLGIVISIRNNVLTVISPIEGTPASRLGIQAGDKILYIDGEPTKGFTSEDAVKRLRGPEGSEVEIRIRREGVDELLDYTITRAIIKLKSVRNKYINEDGVGYVRVSQFSKRTSSELSATLDSLEGVGINGLVLDLRSNPGGLLDQAVEVSDLFLDSGQLITYTKGRKRNTNNRFVDRANSRHGDYPLVVLVDGGSASASEIVSGAIQDWDRGLVVGNTTFGKGSVQSVLPLSQDTGLKLTTAKYYTPSGRSIHKDDTHLRRRGELAMEDVEDGEEKEIFLTKNQGRTVYGGGGITPDIQIDQRYATRLEEIAERKQVYWKFAIEYTAHHEVDRDWEVSDEVFADFHEEIDATEEEYTEEEWDESIDYLRNGIKREIFRKLFGEQAAFEVTVEVDDQLQRTFDLFKEYGGSADLLAVTETHKAAREALAAAEKTDEEGEGEDQLGATEYIGASD